MPGKRITINQIGIYMQLRSKEKTQKVAAAKSGFSERSARNVEKREFKEASKARTWRTRKSPFEKVWDSELRSMLEANSELQATTLLEYLQEKYPGEYPDNLLRTLQRQIRNWKALEGPENEVIFRQETEPGYQSLSDFTWCNELNITINGEALSHRLFHFRLADSGWEYANVVLGGESFTALSENLQNALMLCGGITKTHRTDSLSAAFKNLPDKAKEEFTEKYQSLCKHYGMEPTRNNKGVAHENGSIESSHRHLKTRIKQALILRGSSEFSSIEEYRHFVSKVVKKRNRANKSRYLKELPFLGSLPGHRSQDFNEKSVKVTTSSIIRLGRAAYSVPSRLIGRVLRVHLFDDRIECYLGDVLVHKCARLHPKGNESANQINYRHFIYSLVRKPQAFRRFVFRDHLFPMDAFKQTWEVLDADLDERSACKEYVGILKLASEGDNETRVSSYLERCLREQKLPSKEECRDLFGRPKSNAPAVSSPVTELQAYDALIPSFGGGR